MKMELRKKYLDLMKNQDKKLKHDNEKKVIQKFLNSDHFKLSSKIAVYLARDFEFDTTSIINQALIENKEVFVPLENDDIINFKHLKILANQKFQKDKFGIMVPVLGLDQKPVNIIEVLESVDLILVPFLAFNNANYRIGSGSGYYDRLLPNINALKVGLGFEFQKSEQFEVEPHDKPLDIIHTA